MGKSRPTDNQPLANDMDLLETTTHSFIIKIWLEETGDEAGEAVWRGRITHVPSGEKRYLKGLSEISTFILPYLESMGVKPKTRERFARWLQQLRERPLEEQAGWDNG